MPKSERKPVTAFMRFLLVRYESSHGIKSVTEFSKEAGQAWRALSEAEKQVRTQIFQPGSSFWFRMLTFVGARYTRTRIGRKSRSGRRGTLRKLKSKRLEREFRSRSSHPFKPSLTHSRTFNVSVPIFITLNSWSTPRLAARASLPFSRLYIRPFSAKHLR